MMPRYCVNAIVEKDGWAYVDADSPEDAMDEASNLSPQDFETDATIGVQLVNAEVDA